MINKRHRCYVFPVKMICNADCRFCFVKELDSPAFVGAPEMLSLDALRAAAREFGLRGITEVEITGGGEPMLHPRIQEIVDVVGGRGDGGGGRGDGGRGGGSGPVANGAARRVKLYTNGMRLRAITGIDELNVSRCHWDTARNNEIYRTHRPTDLRDVLEFYRPLVGTIRVQVVLLRGYVDTPERMLEFVERHSDLVDTFMFRTLFSGSDRLRELYTEATLDHPKVKMDATGDTYEENWSINTAGEWVDGMPW